MRFGRWTKKKLAELCLEHLTAVIPDAKKIFRAAMFCEHPSLIPFFLNEYEKERQNFEQSTNIENLLSVGRNGEFSHMFMEDVYWRTQKSTDVN